MKNIWDLDVDIRFVYSARVPFFRRGDSAVINIKLSLLKERIDISNFQSANMNIKYPSTIIKNLSGVQVGSGIDAYIQFEIPKNYSEEVGFYDTIVSVIKDNGTVSTQKIPIFFFDNVGKSELQFVKMIQDLQNQINHLGQISDDLVKKSQIGVPNGVVPLNSNGKVPISYMPIFLQEHINTNLYLKLVHGWMVDRNKFIVYETKDGSLEYVGHKDNSGANNKLNLIISVIDSIAHLKYSGKGNPVIQKWMYGNKSIEDMRLSGISFTGLSFKVENIGIHTVYYTDNFGNEYVYKFNVLLSQLKPPTVTVTVDRDGSVKIDSDIQLDIKKIAKGHRDIAYFKDNGTILTNNYRIIEAGEYTIYYKDKHGREYVKYIIVTEDQLVGDDKDAPEIKFIANPTTPTNVNVMIDVIITDKSTIIDRRYKVWDFSGAIPTEQDFKNNLNYGEKLSSNNTKLQFSKNGRLYVYAVDEHGNSAFKYLVVSNIDTKPPELKAYDIWNHERSVYEIYFEAIDADSGLKSIKIDNQYFPLNGTYNTEGQIDLSSIKNITFIIEDRAGNSKTFVYQMKGKVLEVKTVNRNAYIIRENGSLYGNGDNSMGQLGIGIDSDTTYKKYKEFMKVKINKASKIFTSEYSINIIDNEGRVWECGGLTELPYNKGKYNSGHKLSTPTIYTGISNVSDGCDNYSLQSGMSVFRSNGQWYGFGGGNGQNGTGIQQEFKSWQKIGTACPVQFNKIQIIDDFAFYFGVDGKIYSCGRNGYYDNIGIPTSSSGANRIILSPQDATLINPKGSTKLIGKGHGTSVWWVMSNKVIRTGGDIVETVKEFSEMSSSDPLSVCELGTTGNNDLLIAYKDGLYFQGSNQFGYFGDGTMNPVGTNTFKKMNWSKGMISASGVYDTVYFIDDNYGFYYIGTDENITTPRSAINLLRVFEQVQ